MEFGSKWLREPINRAAEYALFLLFLHATLRRLAAASHLDATCAKRVSSKGTRSIASQHTACICDRAKESRSILTGASAAPLPSSEPLRHGTSDSLVRENRVHVCSRHGAACHGICDKKLANELCFNPLEVIRNSGTLMYNALDFVIRSCLAYILNRSLFHVSPCEVFA
jgi:hypothetical protein